MRLLRSAIVRLIDWWSQIPMALRAIAPLAVMATLWFSSSRTPEPQEPSDLRMFLHNGAHIVAYAGLAGAWLLALLPRVGDRAWAISRGVVVSSILLSVGYGIVDELHQKYVPGRACSVWDVVSDACGSLLAAAFVLWALTGERRFAVRVGVMVLVSLASVAAATW